MAKFVTIDPVIVVGGSTVTASCVKSTISLEADDNITTNFASAGWKERIGGLKGGSVDFEFQQDFGTAALDSVLFPLLGTVAAVTVRPGGSAAIGTTNPEYQFSILVSQYNPMDSAVGDLATVSVGWPITGAVTRATA